MIESRCLWRVVLRLCVFLGFAACAPFQADESVGPKHSSGVPASVTPGDDSSLSTPSSVTSSEGGLTASSPFVFVPRTPPFRSSFADDFSRPDGPIGNGWAVKSSASFALIGGQVVNQNFAWTVDEAVFHSDSQTYLDIEVSATYTSPTSNFGGNADLLVRVTPSSDQVGTMHAYGVRIDGGSVSVIRSSMTNGLGGSSGSIGGPEAWYTLPVVFAAGRPYRISVRVTGSNTPLVEGAVFEVDSSLPIASVRAIDTSASRIVSAGRTGFASSDLGGRWDDLRRNEL